MFLLLICVMQNILGPSVPSDPAPALAPAPPLKESIERAVKPNKRDAKKRTKVHLAYYSLRYFFLVVKKGAQKGIDTHTHKKGENH